VILIYFVFAACSEAQNVRLEEHPLVQLANAKSVKPVGAGDRIGGVVGNCYGIPLWDRNTGDMIRILVPPYRWNDTLHAMLYSDLRATKREMKIPTEETKIELSTSLSYAYKKALKFKPFDFGARGDTLVTVGFFFVVLTDTVRDKFPIIAPIPVLLKYSIADQRFVGIRPFHGLPKHASYYDASVSPDGRFVVWHGVMRGRLSYDVVFKMSNTGEYKRLRSDTRSGTKLKIAWNSEDQKNSMRMYYDTTGTYFYSGRLLEPGQEEQFESETGCDLFSIPSGDANLCKIDKHGLIELDDRTKWLYAEGQKAMPELDKIICIDVTERAIRCLYEDFSGFNYTSRTISRRPAEVK
jgi:hypothetical protein